MRKFPKLKYPSHESTDGILDGEVVVTEKLDGANFRFSWEDGLVVGTRNHTYRHDDENLPKAFEHAVEYLHERLAEADNTWLAGFQSGDWTLFGEAMHYHSLKYTDIDYVNPQSGAPYFGEYFTTSDVEREPAPNVVLFDIFHEDEGWLPWDEVENIVKSSPFVLTDVLDRGNGHTLKSEGALSIPEESMFGGNPEGIVVRRTDGSVRAKKVSEDFKEQNAQAFDDPSKASSDAAQFVAGYVTNARIEKRANALVDEGQYDAIEMPMMRDLPREVLVDAMHEVAWDELLNGDFEAVWDDDFKSEVRSRTSKKCARVLKQMCQEF